MRTQVVMELQAPPRPWWLSSRALGAWWVIAGVALLFGLGLPPVQRTQEARVLETAREMRGGGWGGWIVPHCNGAVRVRKPPLAYWMAAAAYEIGGVSEGVGRVPTALLGWLTLAVTFACAQWLFGRRAGFFAAACLLCSYLFFRHSRLAETDAPAMFFVTLGIYAFWRGVGRADLPAQHGADARIDPASSPSSLWFHLGAAATALAILSKGPPGIYPPLFLLILATMRRRWDALRRFVTSGAPLTLLVLAAPWFVYVFHAVGIEQWKHESDELLGGEDHRGHFYQYFAELFKATAPWCLLVIGSLVAGWQHRRDRRVAGVLAWLAVIFVPLCFVANKQFHYLMPLMPPMMILVGWWIDLVLRPVGEDAQRRAVPLLDATILITALGVPGLLLAARFVLGKIGLIDWALAAGITMGLLVVGWVFFRRGRTAALLAYTAAVLLVLVPAVSILSPHYDGDNSRQIARQIEAHLGRGPYCFYGGNLSLPLVFNWRTVVPQEVTAADLEQLALREPDVVVIAQTKSAHAPPQLPRGFREQWRLRLPRQTMVFYRRAPGDHLK